MPDDHPDQHADGEQQSPLDRAQDAIDEAREAAGDALPSDPLEGTEPEPDEDPAD